VIFCFEKLSHLCMFAPHAMFPEASPTSAYFSTAIQGKDFQRLPGVT
jgi:hypothetical protein